MTETLDLSAGAYVKGIALLDSESKPTTTFLAAVTFEQLRTITRDPDVLQPNSKRGNDDPDIAEERELHALVQRALAGSKKTNVPKYMRYIEQLIRDERPGVLPPIHLWSIDSLQIVTNGPTQYGLVPNGEHLLAIDGETQLTAHFLLARSETVDHETKRRHRKYPLSAVIHHGVSQRVATQYFHDLNILAVRPNTSLGLAMDTEDPITQIVGAVEDDVPQLHRKVEKLARQLPKKSSKIVTLQNLRQMVIDVARGMAGVQYGSRPVPLDDLDLKELGRVATNWIGAYFETFATEIADRENYLAGSGPVLAAVGAIGHQLLTAPSHSRAELSRHLLNTLKEVDWKKGEHWTNIAGGYTAAGVFSVKGTKEVAYAVFNALTDPSNSGYDRIRPGTSAESGAGFQTAWK